jgi:hypothetical protein
MRINEVAGWIRKHYVRFAVVKIPTVEEARLRRKSILLRLPPHTDTIWVFSRRKFYVAYCPAEDAVYHGGDIPKRNCGVLYSLPIASKRRVQSQRHRP